jgi:hypothetical protein
VLAPMAGSPVWVFIEHGGSYAAPLALAMLVRFRNEPSAARFRKFGGARPGTARTPTGSALLETGGRAGQLEADLAFDDLAKRGVLG